MITDYFDYLLYAAIAVLCLYISIQLLNIGSLLSLDEDDPERILSDNELPLISVLVAARNEEANIWRCLSALHQMNYPKHKIEILVGDDQSEDRTKEIAEAFAKDHEGILVVSIRQQLGKAQGKANVLAQLAHIAKGEYYLITDADVAVSRSWAREIVSHFDEKTAIVSGATIVEDEGTMGRMQEIDWMYFMGLLRSFSNLGLNCTAVGNNMAISRKAYWDVGGYETLDFSVTEDYKLYKEVRKRGWDTKNILNPRIINRSRAIHQFRALMSQRKRWLTGGRELPFYWWIFFGIFGLFAPAIVIVAFASIKLALIFYFIKLAMQSITVYILQDKMNIQKTFDYLVTYEIYSIVVALATQLFYFMPFKLYWKKRSYNV